MQIFNFFVGQNAAAIIKYQTESGIVPLGTLPVVIHKRGLVMSGNGRSKDALVIETVLAPEVREILTTSMGSAAAIHNGLAQAMRFCHNVFLACLLTRRGSRNNAFPTHEVLKTLFTAGWPEHDKLLAEFGTAVRIEHRLSLGENPTGEDSVITVETRFYRRSGEGCEFNTFAIHVVFGGDGTPSDLSIGEDAGLDAAGARQIRETTVPV